MRRSAILATLAVLGATGCDADLGHPPMHIPTTWTHVQDGDARGHDRALDVEVDANDDIVVGGYLSGADRADDLWLRKLDRGGEEIWTVLDETGPDMGAVASGLAIDDEGNIAVVGSFFATEHEGWDILVRSYDSDGELRWEHIHTGAVGADDQGVGAAAFPDGRVVAVGFEGQTAPERKLDVDGWVALFDNDGELLWSDTYAGPAGGVDAILDVAVAPSGDIVVAGYEEVVDNDSNIWLRGYDGAGEPKWTLSHPGGDPGLSRGTSVAIDPAGHFFVSGLVYIAGNALDAWVSRHRENGELVWARTHNGPAQVGVDMANDLAIDANGDVVVTGLEFMHDEAYNVWVRKYDAAGTERWTHMHSGAALGDDQGAGIAIDSRGSVYVAGSEFQRKVEFEPEDCDEDQLTDDGECPPIFDTDAWLRKITPRGQ